MDPASREPLDTPAAHAKIVAGGVAGPGAMSMTWQGDDRFFCKRANGLKHTSGMAADHRRTVIERIPTLRTGPHATLVTEPA